MKLSNWDGMGNPDQLRKQIGLAGEFLGYGNEERNVYELAHRCFWYASYYNATASDVKKVAKKIIKSAKRYDLFDAKLEKRLRIAHGHVPKNVTNM